ncbi:MAG: LysM peptidoglycan-binding domain-containing protein [Balneolaceae bacterium]|nr:MAG: LysM peptidoglycan-binding domain-containing protein [Balneolaceae bacterium]
MNRFLKLLLITAFSGIFSVMPSLLQAQGQERPEIHEVRQGDTLFSIAREYDITITELRAWNQLESDQLQPGQTLRLLPPDSGDQLFHTVEAGESLFAISRMYGVTIAEIQQWNQLENSSIDAGTELIIYHSDSFRTQRALSISEIEQMSEQERSSVALQINGSESNSDIYTVRSGDTLYQIARNHEMTVGELRQLNNLTGDALRVGQRIMVRSVRSAPSVAEGAENSTPQGRFSLYRVERGETLQSLLNRFQMSERELMALNPGLSSPVVTQGQQLTVLLPPTRTFANPYRPDARLEDLGTIHVTRYSDGHRALPTTSGELYNPNLLTAAHSNMSLGSVIFIENPVNGNGIYVRINDRHTGDGLKLSHNAYRLLNFSSNQSPMVTIYLEN